jgi:hypothetical protein
MDNLSAISSEIASNRRELTSKNEGCDAITGIDWLTLSFPVEESVGDSDAWDHSKVVQPGQPDATFTSDVRLPLFGGGSVRLGLTTTRPGSRYRQWGKLEYNPSRVVNPDGWELVSVDDALTTIDLVAQSVATRVVPVNKDVRSWRTKRIDVARDFIGVDNPSGLLRSLAIVNPKWARRSHLFTNPQRGGAQTLQVGSKAGYVRLYDKYQETKGLAPSGTVRWEVEARAWASSYGAIETLGDINKDTVGALAANRWEWSQMGSEVAGTMSQVISRISHADISPAKARGFLGWLVQESVGADTSDISSGTLAAYRKLRHHLGIAVPADLRSMSDIGRRLDWESGKEVVSVHVA